MGNLSETLGLGGSPKQTAPDTSRMANDPLSILLGGAASGPTGMSTAIGNYQPPQQAENPDDIVVKGDDWQPHKRTTLGAIGDFLSVLGGGGQVFRDKKDQQNMTEAMQGLFADPKHVIERMARITGHADDAWKMYNEYTDNERMQGTLDRQNRALDGRNEGEMYQYAAGMMGAANEDNWKQMRELALKRGAARQVDLSQLIPEEYDPTSIEFMRNGAIKPKDQENLKVRRDTLEERRDYHDATEAQAATNEAGRNSRNATNEGGRNDRAAASRTAAAARQQKSLDAKNKKGTRFIKTPEGDMALSPSGMTGQIIRDDGRIEIWQKSSPGHWTKIKDDARN